MSAAGRAVRLASPRRAQLHAVAGAGVAFGATGGNGGSRGSDPGGTRAERARSRDDGSAIGGARGVSFARAEGQCRTLRWACRCSASRAAPKAPCHFTPSARLFRRPSVGPPPVTRGRSRPRREVWAGSDGRNGLPKPPEKMRADRLEGATPPGLGTSFDAKNRSRDRTDAARTTRGRRVGGVRTGKRRGGGFVDTKRNPVRQCVISLRSRGKKEERAS